MLQPKKTFLVEKEEELTEVAQYIISLNKDISIYTFQGNLGSGKTTLVKQLCAAIDCIDDVSSPTYAYVNEYADQKSNPIFHMDCYRLKNTEEAIDIGMEDYIHSGCYCFIEWPEHILSLLPDQYIDIHIKKIENELRQIRIFA